MTSKKWIKKTQSPRSVASEAKAALQSLVKSAKVKPRHKWQDMADLISKGDGIMDATPWGFTVAEPDGSREVEVDGGWTEEHYQFLVPILSQVDEAQLNKAMIARAVLEAKLHGMGVKSQIQGSACLLRSTVSMKKTGYPSRWGQGVFCHRKGNGTSCGGLPPDYSTTGHRKKDKAVLGRRPRKALGRRPVD